MSSIIKSQFTNNDHWNRGKTIQIKRFASASSIEQEENLRERLEQEAENLILEAQAKAEAIEQQSQMMLSQAKRQIEHDQQQWEDERQRIAWEAKQQGYQEGLRQGKQEGMQAYETLLTEARAMIELTKQDYYSYMESSEEIILHLGLEIAEKIIGQQLAQDPEKLLSLVRTALKEVRDHKEIQLFVSVSSYPFIQGYKEELMALLNGEASLFIYPDGELADTSCIIESSFGRIDASVDSQLDEIKKQLTELLKEDVNES
ncbi:flagellar assembly protein FliH [Priestia abyssalis]|uniref:flagellar assembly protein FliH n=1 Tax=Priestia abyssalis TaxID=1221450 RepID=UPI001472DCCE|nr:flagellar assembly protein FliH [Priestia abyssalis]